MSIFVKNSAPQSWAVRSNIPKEKCPRCGCLAPLDPGGRFRRHRDTPKPGPYAWCYGDDT